MSFCFLPERRFKLQLVDWKRKENIRFFNYPAEYSATRGRRSSTKQDLGGSTDVHLPGCDTKPYQFTETTKLVYAYRETTKLSCILEPS